jgi:acyl-CoA thioester hydrolase
VEVPDGAIESRHRDAETRREDLSVPLGLCVALWNPVSGRGLAVPDASSSAACVTELRVRYSETDQMGTFYNSRALEWFECGRTELLRALGVPYAEMEARGVLLPLVEAHVEYQGRARYDDLLRVTTTATMAGKARVRFDLRIVQARDELPVARGYTVHAIASPQGKPTRPPEWFLDALGRAK